jgi:membrane protease YdiL (CAAX protease family)
MFAQLHPKNILIALDEIDAQAPSHTMENPQALRRVFAVLACVSGCLLFMHYAKFSDNLQQLLQIIAGWKNLPANYYVEHLVRAGVWELSGYVWWTSVQVIGYLLLPALLIRINFKARVRDFGWQLNEAPQHWRGYLLLLSPILVFIYLVSLGKDFVNHYPFYSLASRSWVDLFAWEFLYLIQFVCLEFFFRGFILNSLRPALGANAIWVMCVPYLMIHFPKLWLEATGAILFGLFLGILALRSRSIWGGVLVHAGVALTMDITAILRKHGLPENLWPF